MFRYSKTMSKKSVIVGLPIVPYNQTKHSDVCQYLQHIEELLLDVYTPDNEQPIPKEATAAEISARSDRILKDVKIPLGGDLLGRERVTGAKKTRMGCDSGTERFDSIVENVAQWHAKQSFLAVCYSYVTITKKLLLYGQ